MTKYKQLTVIGISLLLAFLYLLPFGIMKGVLYGDDLHFHLDRILGLANIFESPVNFKTFYNSGQGINFFYPYVTYYPFYLIFTVVKSLWVSWYLYLYGVTVATIMIAFYSGKGISKSEKVGWFFAIVYTFSTYRSYNILQRFATGEILAFTFLPLIFYGFYEISKGNYKKWYLLSFGMICLMYSHVLSVFMVSILLGILMLVTLFFWDNKIQRILSLLKAAGLTLLATSFVYLPMFEQYRYTKISSPFTAPLNTQTLTLQEFLYGNIENVLNRQLGVFFWVLLILVVLAFKKMTKTNRLLFFISLILIVMTTRLMNWDVLNQTPLAFIQFPWRLNTYVTLFICYLAAVALKNIDLKTINLLLMMMFAFHAGSVIRDAKHLAEHPVQRPWGELSDRRNYYELTHAVFVPDYTNAVLGISTNIDNNDPRWKIVHNEVYLNQKMVKSDKSYSDSKAIFKINNKTQQSAVVYLPVYRYKGQSVYLDGQKIPSQLSPLSSTEIKMPKGKHTVLVSYSYTFIAKLSVFISVFGASLLIWVYYKNKNK